MFKKQKLFFISVVTLLTCSVSAQQVYELDTLYPVHSLDYLLQVYPDSLDVLTPEQVLHDSDSDFLKGDQLPRLLEVGITYWGKVKIRSKHPLKDWTLHFEDKMIGPPAWTKGNGKVDVYAYRGEELIFHQKTGAEYTKKDKTYNGNWVLNAIDLEPLPINEEINLVMRVEGNSLGYPSYFNLTVRSPKQPFYHEFNQFHASFNLFLFGVTFIILLYHLLQYFYLRESINLWFSLWLFCCALTQAMTVGLIIGNFSSFRYPFWFIIANSQFFSFWFFGRVFIGSKIKFPKLDKVMLGLALLILIEIILMAFYVILAKPQTYLTGVGFHYTILNIYAVISLIVAIVLILKKDLFARYFGVGVAVAGLSLVIGTLWSMGFMRPPFRLDPYATGIFLQIVLYSFGIAYRRQTLAKRNQEERIMAERSRAEMLRIKDLDELKTRFFTNISHEFRTPLTLIQGPIQQAKQANENGNKISIDQKDFDIVQRSTTRLQNLVDELLELSKLEGGQVKLSLKKGNIVSAVKAMVYSFESMAESSQITLEVSFPEKEVFGYFDPNRLEKIVNNLMSNALKYTPSGGTVRVHSKVVEDELIFSVSDTGKGISENDVPLVFDRFYRVEGSEQKGSGIGLALTKELVELHNGTISLASVLGEGTTFNMVLPISLEKLPSSVIIGEESEKVKGNINPEVSTIPGAQEFLDSPSDLPLALVVEDNQDLRNYILGILKKHYKVLLAKDGQDGITRALEKMPDIVVSDVMMPKKNGFELCDALKKDIKTSHIPIILLTAKAGHENKMEGLGQGADAYLTKPFNADELLLRMNNLIAVRERLWEKVKGTDGILVDNLELTSMDDKFLKKVFKTIHEHLDDGSFSVETLSKQVGFSRAQLHRKLKAVLNKSPNHLIAEIRLNKAYKLLESKTGNVSEVAYAVGFSNLSYFSKSFKEKFGLAPSDL